MAPKGSSGHRVAARLLAAALCATASHVCAGATTIELHEHVRVERAFVQLGDVARVRSTDHAAVDRVRAVELGPAPFVGERAVLERSVLAAYVNRRLGGGITWTGPPRVAIERAVRYIDAEGLRESVERALRQWLDALALSRYEVRVAEPNRTLEVPAGTLTHSVKPWAASQSPFGTFVVWVEVRVDQRLSRLVPLQVTLRSWAPRWIAVRKVVAADAAAADAFERREVELVAENWRAPDVLPARARLARDVAAGQMLDWAALMPAVEVARGEAVSARLEHGAVAIEARATALQDGSRGQRVFIRIDGATAPAAAKVVGPAAVRIAE